jgi:uncharacterized membrane-anchored protein
MQNCKSLFSVVSACALAVSAFAAEESLLDKPDFLQGPAKAALGGIAEIQVPEGYTFTGAEGTKKLMEMMGNTVDGSELGFLAPTNSNWFVLFEFDDTGYVKDDEKDKLDADAMLKSIRRGTEQANKQRKQMGIPPVTVVGWEQPPKYNPETHNLEWCIRGESEGDPVVNYNTRVLGRKGVMRVTVVGDPEEVKTALPDFKQLMAGYHFISGQTYAEYKPGDKVAKYGLAALVVGGAGVGAAKLGLLGPVILFFKKAWYLVVAALVAVVSFIKKLFARLLGNRSDSETIQ